ncbi:MAG: hypothetical protein AAF566_14330, partial [Pseudomonadota bacterium]
ISSSVAAAPYRWITFCSGAIHTRPHTPKDCAASGQSIRRARETRILGAPANAYGQAIPGTTRSL